jgi:hypothetical protein
VREIAGMTGAAEFHLSAIQQVTGKGWAPAPDKVSDLRQVLEEWFA